MNTRVSSRVFPTIRGTRLKSPVLKASITGFGCADPPYTVAMVIFDFVCASRISAGVLERRQASFSASSLHPIASTNFSPDFTASSFEMLGQSRPLSMTAA